MDSKALELRNLIQGFQVSCQAEGKSPRTVEWYLDFLKRFHEFLVSKQLPTDASLITKEHVRSFIRYLQTEAKVSRSSSPLSPATIQGYVRSLKAFFSWLVREELLGSNPLKNIPVPKAPVRIVATFSLDQISSLIRVCQSGNKTGRRNQTIILLLLDSGMRVGELVNLTVDDIDFSGGYLRITHPKGDKQRLVPLGSLMQRHLWKYVHNVRPEPIARRENRLFLSGSGIGLTKSGVQQILKRYARKAGIRGVRCSPHTLRHTFAKLYLLNGGDIFSLQKTLGHSSLASVRYYVNLFAPDIKRQHERYSPLDNLVSDPAMRSLARSSGSGAATKLTAAEIKHLPW